MTKNSAPKRAARKYMDEHPGVAYREALKIVTDKHNAEKAAAETARNPYDDPTLEPFSIDELLTGSLDGDMQLLDRELEVAEGYGHAFEVSIPEITEGPIDVVDVTLDLDSVTVDEHEEFEGGTTIGAVRVEADVEWEACVYKADYYAASDDVPWYVIDQDWNDHYVRVSGTLRAELTYHYVADHGAQVVDDITLQGMEQLSPSATAV